MKAREHIKCFCSFWKPTVARRITLYFLLFGVIIFFVTSMLFTIAGKKEFMDSTSKVIHHQLAQLENSNEPDFIWHSLNQPKPEFQTVILPVQKNRLLHKQYRCSTLNLI